MYCPNYTNNGKSEIFVSRESVISTFILMSTRFMVSDQPRVREGDRPLETSFTVERNIHAYVTYLRQLNSSNDHEDNAVMSKSKLLVGKKKKINT